MLEKIISLLPEYCEDIKDINEQTRLICDLNMSSMDFLMFVNNIEDEFDIKISDDETRRLETIGDVLKCIGDKLS